ncbi:WhiB family transcriptional regulator [Mycolicibacterium fortuitum]|uniref:WhiB family transcriptional regulator n=1 Tax=Mycolicibacterium fortuitum TaxID=1766 RepID=UPI00241C5229|nr:WhiB family transcriptional regulator [Mycolicibacterium fortuitum]MDG5773919.1 WhiB family transcriptional regulator [Mycolicibacterium fortuitum]MDG5779696.1 WhiB family transcriptional regulator [Mycolicibacterium fortuitum]
MSIVGEIQVVTHQKGWADLAVCKETDPEAFYVEKGGNTKPAKDTCARCPVTAECLEYALAHDERHGVWGGLTERQRRELKRRIA